MSIQNQNSATVPTFEEALGTLEQIVRDLEGGNLGLAESLARYEEGVKLLKQCYGLLEQAEHRIEMLAGVDAAGKPVLAPFEHEATLNAGESDLPRSRRNKSNKKDRQPASPDENSIPPKDEETGSLF